MAALFVWPNSFETDAIGAPLESITTVAKVLGRVEGDFLFDANGLHDLFQVLIRLLIGYDRKTSLVCSTRCS